MNGNHFDAIKPTIANNHSQPVFIQAHKQGGVIE